MLKTDHSGFPGSEEAASSPRLQNFVRKVSLRAVHYVIEQTIADAARFGHQDRLNR
jgi:hypothetical protein